MNFFIMILLIKNLIMFITYGVYFMEIKKVQDEKKLTVLLEGKLDTNTAPKLDEELKTSLDGIEDLIFDFNDLQYISSSGLRVLLATQKTMNKQGAMKIINVNDFIMEVFDATGFIDVMDIE